MRALVQLTRGIVRDDPLPPGRYWIILTPPTAAGRPDPRWVFSVWADAYRPLGMVQIESSEKDAETGVECTFFRVLKPTPWGVLAEGMGWPNSASDSDNCDTVLNPDKTPPVFAPGGALEGGHWYALGIAGVAAVGFLGIAYLVSKR